MNNRPADIITNTVFISSYVSDVTHSIDYSVHNNKNYIKTYSFGLTGI